MTLGTRPRAAAATPKFVTGSVLRHILVMTGTGALGLMAVFFGDLVNIYFLSLSGDATVIAAIGYASSLLFFSTSVGIGLSIASSALVSPAVGAQLNAKARRLSTHTHLFAFAVATAISVPLWFSIPVLLEWLGATGRAHELATLYLSILIPTTPLISLGMTSSSVLRSVGDARRAMFVTLAGAAVNAVLDAILIVKYGLGVEGAAIATALARCTIVAVGLYGVVGVHRLYSAIKPTLIRGDWQGYFVVALPAVLTNLATPAGNAYVTATMSSFSDDAVAAWAIIGRITPVAFGAIFALSGAVGPIIGQNFGAREGDRMREVLTRALGVTCAFTLTAWIFLIMLSQPLANAFNASEEASALIIYFCRWLSPLFVFLGGMFIANATFNVLGKPHLSTALNWGRATLGTVPFVSIGANMDAARGVLTGQMLGGVFFGLFAVFLAYRLVNRITERMRIAPPGP